MIPQTCKATWDQGGHLSPQARGDSLHLLFSSTKTRVIQCSVQMLSKCHQIFLTYEKTRLLCAPEWTCTCLSIESQEKILILFLLPLFTLCCFCPGGPSTPLLKMQLQRFCVYFWPMGSRMRCVQSPKRSVGRVEESKPGSFLSLLILGRNSEADLSPSNNSSGSDHGASQQSSSVHDWESCSVPVSFIY